MKFLRNPIVTGILAVVAVIVVLVQIAPHTRFSFRGASPPPLAAPPAPTPVPRPHAATTTGPVALADAKAEAERLPQQTLDREFLKLHFDGWVKWPQRDPFQVISPDPPDPSGKNVETNSPVASWKLRAIWAQTASKPLAVINQRVYGEGDEIQGYKIIKIDGDEVLFQGPHRKERLALERRVPAHP